MFKKKIAFFGSDDFSSAHLEFIVKKGVNVELVVCPPDKPKGRGRRLSPPEIKLTAEKLGLKVMQVKSLKKQKSMTEILKEYDLAVVVSFGQIIPPEVFNAPKMGIFNVHPSLLPRWRGAAPIQRALEAGDKETGVTIFKINEKLDAGPIVLKEKIKIGEFETYGKLKERLIELGSSLLLKFLSMAEREEIELTPQSDEGATYARKIEKDDPKIDFFQDAEVVKNKIRAYDPVPGAFCHLKDQRIKIFGVKSLVTLHDTPGKILKISKEGAIISCGYNSVLVEKLQFAGKNPIRFLDAMNGRKINVGDVLR